MMQGRTLRTLVGAIALFIAVITAVAVPAGYFVVNYTNASELLAFKARLNAARVAQYVYTHDIMWQYQHLRLYGYGERRTNTDHYLPGQYCYQYRIKFLHRSGFLSWNKWFG